MCKGEVDINYKLVKMVSWRERAGLKWIDDENTHILYLNHLIITKIMNVWSLKCKNKMNHYKYQIDDFSRMGRIISYAWKTQWLTRISWRTHLREKTTDSTSQLYLYMNCRVFKIITVYTHTYRERKRWTKQGIILVYSGTKVFSVRNKLEI